MKSNNNKKCTCSEKNLQRSFYQDMFLMKYFNIKSRFGIFQNPAIIPFQKKLQFSTLNTFILSLKPYYFFYPRTWISITGIAIVEAQEAPALTYVPSGFFLGIIIVLLFFKISTTNPLFGITATTTNRTKISNHRQMQLSGQKGWFWIKTEGWCSKMAELAIT